MLLGCYHFYPYNTKKLKLSLIKIATFILQTKKMGVFSLLVFGIKKIKKCGYLLTKKLLNLK